MLNITFVLSAIFSSFWVKTRLSHHVQIAVNYFYSQLSSYICSKFSFFYNQDWWIIIVFWFKTTSVGLFIAIYGWDVQLSPPL